MSNRNWIVCCAIGRPAATKGGFTTTVVDRWTVFDDHAEAKNYYESLYEKEEVLVRSLCAVMDSSDYEPHPAFSDTHNQEM